MRWLIGLFLVVALAMPALAVQPDEVLPDAAMESRARQISAELRCLVCQNESIDDSNAPLARDLRLLVRERLKAGDSDADVMDLIVARYGEFVLLRPVFGTHTLLLWLAPVAIFLLGAFVALRFVRQGRRRETAPLSDQEKARLDAVLRRDGETPDDR